VGSLQNPTKTVLVVEGSAFDGFSWHKPHKELMFRDSLNEVGYVDNSMFAVAKVLEQRRREDAKSANVQLVKR
jgi:hypothetical protein